MGCLLVNRTARRHPKIMLAPEYIRGLYNHVVSFFADWN